MGINDLLPHLPGGGKNEYKHSFYGVIECRAVVPLDAASALWQFAAHHGWDYLRGNCIPALILWARFLVYLRDICGWTLHVFMDGRENADKLPEIQRRRETAQIAEAEERHELFGQIKNTPEYIALAVHVCNFLKIRVTIAAYEADPQVSYMAMQFSLIPVTGDSDLLAYGIPDDPGKLIVVKTFRHDWFRVIDLNATVEPGEYPLLDLYRKAILCLDSSNRGSITGGYAAVNSGLTCKMEIIIAKLVPSTLPQTLHMMCMPINLFYK